MCGRFFRVSVSYEEYLAQFELFESGDVFGTEAAYNVAPTQYAPIIRETTQGEGRELALARWGLVPAWWNKPLREMKYSTFNARSETADKARLFRAAWKYRRCLVPVSGYYEWSGPKGRKTPHAIGCRNRRLFCLGGLWEQSTVEGESIDSFTILTTTPNTLMSEIHNRMPVIVRPYDYRRWLGPNAGDSRSLCNPIPSEEMEAWKVGPAVGNVRNQGSELIEEV